MRKIQCLFLMFLATFLGCKKNNCPDGCPNQAEAYPNFNFNSGWQLVQGITSDVPTSGSSQIGYYGFDFMGANNHLRCMYYQGWLGQQGFLFSNTRLDEFDANQQLVNRKELDFENSFASVFHGVGIENYYMLRNGKPSILTQYEDGTGKRWQLYENGVLSSQESVGHFSYGIGAFEYADEQSLNFYDSYQDVTKIWFYYKRYENGIWETYPQGSFPGVNSDIVGAEKINDTAYVFIAENLGNDSTKLSALKLDGNNQWVPILSENVPFGNFDYTSNSGKVYLSNGNTPSVILFTNAGFSAFEINLLNNSVNLKGSSLKTAWPRTIDMSKFNYVMLNNEIYFAYIENSLPYVAKLSTSGPQMIGSGALVLGNNYQIDLEVKDNHLYAIVYNRMVSREQIYIARPQ